VEELLYKLKRHNIDIDTVDDQLRLQIPENLQAGELLQEIRNNKQELIAHLKRKKISADEALASSRIEHEGECYYAITRFQAYWANEEIDREFKKNDNIHGSINSMYEVIGAFDAAVFKRCVVAIVNRHESLRATFHKVQNRYLMRVEPTDLPQYEPVYRDLRNDVPAVEPFVRFHDHRFSVTQGPLFAVRIARVKDERYTVSFKMHHIIGDALSMRLLLQELLQVYDACRKDQHSQLPALKKQYKDYLAVLNLYYSHHYQQHRLYWKERYNTLPPPYTIPGANSTPAELNKRICKTASFLLPPEITTKLGAMAGRTSASFFVILQTAWKKFLSEKTGVTDLTIGTSISGRDQDDMQNQVGCYAKTVLVRTVFEPADTFEQVVDKVKHSNEEMKSYQAFTLFDALMELRPPGYAGGTHFQKVNMHFEDSMDMRDEFGNSLFRDLRFARIHTVSNSHIPIDMQLSFYASGQEIALEVQYDSSMYEAAALNSLIHDFINYTNSVL